MGKDILYHSYRTHNVLIDGGDGGESNDRSGGVSITCRTYKKRRPHLLLLIERVRDEIFMSYREKIRKLLMVVHVCRFKI